MSGLDTPVSRRPEPAAIAGLATNKQQRTELNRRNTAEFYSGPRAVQCYGRRLLRAVRISLIRISGCSRAAKWPPLSASP